MYLSCNYPTIMLPIFRSRLVPQLLLHLALGWQLAPDAATRSLAAAGHEHLPALIAPSGRIPEERAKVAESPRHQKPGPGGRFASAEAAHRKGHRRPGITQAQEQPGR